MALPQLDIFCISAFLSFASRIIIFSRGGSASEIGNVAVLCTCCTPTRRRYNVPERTSSCPPHHIFFFSLQRALHLELQCCLRTGKHRLAKLTRRERRACNPQFYTRTRISTRLSYTPSRATKPLSRKTCEGPKKENKVRLASTRLKIDDAWRESCTAAVAAN